MQLNWSNVELHLDRRELSLLEYLIAWTIKEGHTQCKGPLLLCTLTLNIFTTRQVRNSWKYQSRWLLRPRWYESILLNTQPTPAFSSSDDCYLLLLPLWPNQKHATEREFYRIWVYQNETKISGRKLWNLVSRAQFDWVLWNKGHWSHNGFSIKQSNAFYFCIRWWL